MVRDERRQLEAILATVNRVDNKDLRLAFRWAVTQPRFILSELEIINRGVNRANQLLAGDTKDPVFLGFNAARKRLHEFGRGQQLPSVCPPSPDHLIELAAVANREIPSNYTDPATLKSNENIVKWFTTDAIARLMAIQLKIPNESRYQEKAADDFCAAICEGIFLLADDGREIPKAQVAWMLATGFMKAGPMFSEELVRRAEVISSSRL